MALINRKTISRIEMALKLSAVAVEGKVACIDLDDGALVASATDVNYLPIGWFESSMTGDGSTEIGVQLFTEIDCAILVNSSTDPVVAGDLGAICFLHGDSELSMTGTGKSIAGRVWGIVSGAGAGARILVEMAPALGLQGPVLAT